MVGVKLTPAAPDTRRHATSNASSRTHKLISLPSLEPLRRTGHLWRRESLSSALGAGTAARPVLLLLLLRAPFRSTPTLTVVSPVIKRI